MFRITVATVGFTAFAGISTTAQATASRVFVSSTGTDSGVCPISSPCRTLAYALTQTAPQGEIIILNTGGYGQVTINQAVSIISDSNVALINASSGNGITITAGPTDAILLRGLTINGLGSGTNGIVFNSGGGLTVQKSYVLDFQGNGILLQPDPSASPKIVISDVDASNNQGIGIQYSSSGAAQIHIERAVTNNGAYGIALAGNSNGFASITNSTAANNSHGFNLAGYNAASIDAVSATGNSSEGLLINSGNVYLGRSVISGNANGVVVGGGVVTSYRDNRINGNGIDITGPVVAGNLQ